MKFNFLSGDEKKKAFNYLIERFGFPPSLFERFDCYKTAKEIRICSLGCQEYLNKVLNVCDLGFAALRIGKTVKPTTTFVQMFGHLASRNIVEMSEQEARNFISGMDLELQNLNGASDGYVIVRYGEDCLGLGLLRGKFLLNQVPKRKRLNLIEEFEQKD